MGAAFRPRAYLGGVSPAVTRRKEGEDLWRRVVRGVRENMQRNSLVELEKKKETQKERQEEGRKESEEVKKAGTKGKTREDGLGDGLGDGSPAVVDGRDKLQGRGLDRRSARRLRRGDMLIEDRIDLHGLSREKARGVLSMGLRRCYGRGFRCVLVISGKGQGILREEVMSVLDSVEVRDIVVEHNEAQMKDGGGGARYVLLRRRRR